MPEVPVPGVKALGPLAVAEARNRGRLPKPEDAPYPTANARLVLHRSAVLSLPGDRVELDDDWIRTWARATRLGLGRPDHPEDGRLAERVAARRRAALRALAAAADGIRVVTVIAEPQGAFVTGTGDGGIRDVGIELHGTYGWPVLRGTTLKGVARAFARDEGTADGDGTDGDDADEDGTADAEAIFGVPPGSDSPGRAGAVTFLDALPGENGVQVTEHVLTPHTRGYRLGDDGDDDEGDGNEDGQPKPPAEYINPVPVPFLALEGGSFPVHLIGPEPEVTQAAGILARALGEIGLGAKTTSGYGYFKTEVVPGVYEPPHAEPAKSGPVGEGSRKGVGNKAGKRSGKRGGRQ